MLLLLAWPWTIENFIWRDLSSHDPTKGSPENPQKNDRSPGKTYKQRWDATQKRVRQVGLHETHRGEGY